MFTDEDSSRDSIIVEFLPGIRGFCTASVIKEVANMLEQVQPQTPDDVLDYIQINVVSVLAEVVKKADQHGNILEACLRLPQLIFCFVDDYSRSAEDGVGEGYSLGFQLQNLMFSGRSRKEVKTEDGRAAAEENSILSVHVLVDSIDFTMTDLSLRRSSAQHALGVAVKDLVFWASSSETSTASLQMKSLATSIEGYQAMFLYDAVLRTATLVDEIAAKFSTLASFERRRIQHFISGLATAGEVHRITQDPATLTRPSYVLRSATNHVRLNDSWKITARLRHIWQMLPDEDKELWTSKCVENSSHPRRSAKDRLIAVFHRWRGWELGNIKDSVLIKQVFGEEEKDAGPVTKSPFSARLSVDSIALIIDPGPSQDEFVIDQLNGSVVVGNPPSPTSSVGNESAMVTPGVSSHIVVHVHSRSIRLGARWEIIDTLEAVILGLRDRQKDVPAAEPTVSRAPSPPPMISLPSKPKDRFGGFHLIFTADHGSLSLDTVNLRVVSMVQDVKASAVLSEKAVDLQGGKFGKVGSLLLRADYGTLEMCHGNKILSKAVIRTLNLYGYFDEHWISETKFHIWKLTGSSEEISIDVREQVLGLMEVVDLVATDELSHIRQLMDNLEDSSPTDRQKPQQNSPTLSRRNVHMVYCTLALDRFSLRAMLMPSLAYMMRGGGARLSARPNSKNSEEMIIDLGLEQHEYEVCKSVESAEPRVISLLRLPAIHASLRDQNSDEERVVEAAVTVEAVTLEASSIQSLLNAIKKPEVLKLIENARDEWSGISAKLESLVGRKGARPLSLKPEKRLVYRAHAGVSSVKIETLAPSANLEVNLGFIQVHASNKSPGGTILSFPEIRLEFGRITVELSRITGDVRDTCGFLELHASLHASSNQTEEGSSMAFYIKSHSLRIELFAETASTAVDVVGHLQDKLRDLDLSREVKYLRKLRTKPMRVQPSPEPSDIGLFSTAISMDMNAIQVAWIVGGSPAPLPSGFPKQNLVLSFKRIHLSTATRKSNEANLVIEEFLLQMVDANARDIVGRSEDSALMPEVTFKVAYSIKPSQRRLAFRVKGTSLDLRLTSSWVVAASSIETSITTAVEKFRDASSSWKSTPTKSGEERTNMFTTKRLASVLVDADFAGAIVHLGSSSVEGVEGVGPARAFTGPERFGQHAQGETSGITVLKSPGLAFKAEYSDPVVGDPSLMAEIKISASDNTLYPSVVPLIMEISENIKEMMKQPSHTKDAANKAPKEASLESAAPNPVALLGRCRLNVGLRICKQEFTLSCQPIARVAASTQYDQIYATFSTCDDAERGRFYSLSATVTGLGASLRHVYSRESAGSLEVGSATLSLMSSKDVMGAEGLSFMVGFSPIKSQINIKQFQDFLLFREIWFPASLRTSVSAPLALSGAPSPMLVQRYHKVAATNAFPWNTTVAIAGLEVQLDLGQSIGKSVLLVSGLWVTSRKTSDWEQVMCLGFDSIRVSSTGRLSGYIDLGNMNVRTSINWDSAIESMDIVQTPLIEASVGFKLLQAKISFDYQAFLIADISGFNFLMYNLKDKHGEDRLVGVLDGDRVQVYCTTQSAAQGLGVYQAFERLYQDKMTSLEASLKEVESFLTRRGATHPLPKSESIILSEDVATANLPPPALFKLYTDVVVNLKEVHLGAFPNTFYDSSIFKLEALNITARFAVKPKNGRIHSTLEMALGQLSVALTPVKNESAAVSSLADVDAEKVIQAVAASKLRAGNKGIILRVPQVTARMETWHSPGSMVVDYSFKSAFEGQVDVGWNFARVSTIKK